MSLRRFTAATALTAAAAGALCACSAGSTATQAGRENKDSIIVASTSPASSLDFTNTGGAAIPQVLMGNVYETLVTIDDDGELVPHLAESWESNAAATEYTFQLRDGVTFSNGEKFTADTAVFSINNVKDNWTNGLKSNMDPVEHAEAVDELTLKVTLKEPSNRWLWSMSQLTGAMMSPGGVDKLESSPVGTGPYEVERFVPGESVAFHARADYWGPPAHSDAMVKYFSDQIGSVNALRTGDVDVVFGLQSPELIPTLPEEFGVDVGATNAEILLSMNNERAPFDDPRVRRAVAHAINREDVSRTVFEGLSTDTGGAPVAPFDPWFSGEDFAPYDPDKARDLLREAGHPNPKVTITVPARPYADNVSELIYSQLTEVGFDVTLESVEFPAVWLNKVFNAADYHMSIVAHVEPRDFPTLFGNSDYYLKFDDAQTQRLLDDADHAPTQEEHIVLMQQASQRVAEQMGSLTVTNMPNIVITAPGITAMDATLVNDVIDLTEVHR